MNLQPRSMGQSTINRVSFDQIGSNREISPTLFSWTEYQEAYLIRLQGWICRICNSHPYGIWLTDSSSLSSRFLFACSMMMVLDSVTISLLSVGTMLRLVTRGWNGNTRARGVFSSCFLSCLQARLTEHVNSPLLGNVRLLQCSVPAVHSFLQHLHPELVLQLSNGTAGV